jgi:phosphoglycerol transferase
MGAAAGRSGATNLVDLALITLVTTSALIVYKLWSAHLRVVFGYGGDGLLNDELAKNIVQSGWVQHTSRLGAPFGQTLYDFPISGDNGHFLIMRAMAIFTSDWSLIINGFLLFSFYTSAWSSYLSLRWLRCGRLSAAVCALLFAFAPYHFIRGEGHLFLASYFVIPIAVLLTIRASGQPLIASWRLRDGRRGATAGVPSLHPAMGGVVPPVRRSGRTTCSSR